MTHGSLYGPIATQTTTDADGRFSVVVPKMDRATGFPDRTESSAQFYFRVIDHDRAVEDHDAVVKADAPQDVTVHLATAVPAHARDAGHGDATVSGRVLHGGKALADAIVSNPVEYRPTVLTRTKADGSFELSVV